jgi:hypothetical protein
MIMVLQIVIIAVDETTLRVTTSATRYKAPGHTTNRKTG